MTCRETQALDLADFLARPTAPEFAAFRGHYPRCPDCAGEVRAWTELHAALSATTHPSPELLLSYDDAGLAEADRRAIAQHLATCAPCRDELRALAVFDREGALAARPAAAVPRRWLRLPDLGRLMLHPAFAYALVLALLFYPALRGGREVPDSAADRVVGSHREAISDERKDAGEPPLADRYVAAPREERAAPEQAAEAPPPSAPSVRAKSEAPARALGAAPLARLHATASDTAAGFVLSLGPSIRPRMGPEVTDDQITVRIPVRSTLSGRGPLEVRVLDESGDRELRERVPAATDYVEVRLPRAWLAPGAYRVELAAPGTTADVDVFSFDVGR